MVCKTLMHHRQKAQWALEVKWSDRFYHNPAQLKSLIQFCHAQNLTRAGVTTRTERGEKTVDCVTMKFVPASLYCFLLGYDTVKHRVAHGIVPP